jgi:TM2 domain-containing membrane protein YozV
MSKFCNACGKELINPDAEICPNCGGRLAPPKPAKIVNQRSPIVAAILTLIVCGLGQIYNGQLGKGIIYLIVAIICGLLILAIIGIILLPIWYIIAIVDAYKTAQKINADEDASGFFNL